MCIFCGALKAFCSFSWNIHHKSASLICCKQPLPEGVRDTSFPSFLFLSWPTSLECSSPLISDLSFSERFACHNTQPGLLCCSQRLHWQPKRGATSNSAWPSCTSPMDTRPCLLKGHDSVRVTHSHLAINTGRTCSCKVKKTLPWSWVTV